MTIILNIVEPGTLGVTVSADGGSTPAEWLPIVQDWLADRLQQRSILASLREPSRRLAQATDDLSAALAGVSSAAVPFRKRETHMAVDLTDLIDDMNTAQTVIEGATTFVSGVPALIAAAVEEAVSNGATAEQLAPVTALGDDLRAKADALNAAMANVPAQRK